MSFVEKMTTVESLKLSIKAKLSLAAMAIRGLAMDAVHQAGSGHAGTPMGCAEIAAYLYGSFLRMNPRDRGWPNRDRFILSAGHASMLQYAIFHFFGILSLDEIRQFRQLGSRTPSHPEYRVTPGVETTTGLDGQGIAHGVGQALGMKILATKFNRDPYVLYDGKVVVLAGDGCLMEGVSHEVSALAGHWNLDNLILVYDRNKTCLDGFVSETCSEDTAKRYEAYGWEIHEVDGHDVNALHAIFSRLREKQVKPVLIIADTIIGKGAPSKAGSYLIHSEPVGEEERFAAKNALGLPQSEFYVPKDVYDLFSCVGQFAAERQIEWEARFDAWKNAHPQAYEEWKQMDPMWLPQNLKQQLINLEISSPASGRKASGIVINFLAGYLPSLYGGSADLARSDMTYMHAYPVGIGGRNLKYGVREFGMGAIAIGLAQTQVMRPLIGTFLAFSDYMISPIRMAALMQLPIVYQFTHDSIFIGQDGPTHQPIEQLAHLRAIPGLQVLRPADANEVKRAWLCAIKYAGPTALILSRQNLSLCQGTEQLLEEGVERGAYIVQESEQKAQVTLIGTGSELFLALQVAGVLQQKNYAVRVVSMPSWDLFEKQSDEYKREILGQPSHLRISIEAGIEMGWHKYLLCGKAISLHTFGKSATAEDLRKEFGFTIENIVSQILPLLSTCSK